MLYFAERESNIRVIYKIMSFNPSLVEQPTGEFKEETLGAEVASGQKFGLARVVSADKEWIEFCYDESQKNCKDCSVVRCLVNPNRKEA